MLFSHRNHHTYHSPQAIEGYIHKAITMAETKQEKNPKSKEELEAEQQAAKEQLNLLLNQSRPKHVGYGVTSGVSNVVQGAVGGVGLAVLAPAAGLAQGAKQGGFVGGTVGLLGGAVVGAVGGAAVILSGRFE